MLQNDICESLHSADGLRNEELAAADTGLILRKLLCKNRRL